MKTTVLTKVILLQRSQAPNDYTKSANEGAQLSIMTEVVPSKSIANTTNVLLSYMLLFARSGPCKVYSVNRMMRHRLFFVQKQKKTV